MAEGISALFLQLFKQINDFAGWLGSWLSGVFVAMRDVLFDSACWVFEQVLDLVTGILGTLDFSGLTAHVGAWAGLPDSVLEVVSAIGLSTAIGIVVSAIGIRLVLQLIPFTRLGS